MAPCWQKLSILQVSCRGSDGDCSRRQPGLGVKYSVSIGRFRIGMDGMTMVRHSCFLDVNREFAISSDTKENLRKRLHYWALFSAPSRGARGERGQRRLTKIHVLRFQGNKYIMHWGFAGFSIVFCLLCLSLSLLCSRFGSFPSFGVDLDIFLCLALFSSRYLFRPKTENSNWPLLVLLWYSLLKCLEVFVSYALASLRVLRLLLRPFLLSTL